jgi:WD40 repeat protein
VSGKQRSGVFLSYARKDGEAFAANLRERLSQRAPDIRIKQDRLLLEGGVGWWTQITEAIDSVDFLVLVMTPWATQSETVRKEWRYARQQGVCVYPVKAAPDSELGFSKLPRWMRKAHFFDIEKEWDTFVQHLRSPCNARRVPFMAPDLPETFIHRPVQFDQLKSLLLSPDRNEPVAITTALSGAGGFGKTTLAAALCHDEDIVQNFDDGILWVTLGQQANVLGAFLTLYSAFTGERPGFASEEDAAFHLSNKLEDRSCLIVVDDVWDAAHLRPFLRGGKQCARLFTTRDVEIAAEGKRVEVDEMTPEESVALMTAGLPGVDPEQARALSRRLGEWPLAIELARATVRQKLELGEAPQKALQYVSRALEKKGLSAIGKQTAERRHRTIDSTLQAGFGLLPEEDRDRLTELSIFPEDVAIPLSAAGVLWALDEFDTEETAQKFARLSLLRLDLRSGTIRLHDVMRSWLGERVPNAESLHGRLVNGWRDWCVLPDPYAWQWLAWHLARAGRTDELRRILLDPEWLEAKLEATGPNSLITDFEHLKPDWDLALVQGALGLSAHILARDKTQLFSQLRGRLLSFDSPDLQQLLAVRPRRPSLMPATASLTPPGGPLLRTFSGHTDSVTAVAVLPDGQRALSASADRTLRLWNLETGTELRTLAGHTDAVTALALLPDGVHVLSASDDRTLKLWNLETGAELRTFRGHAERVTAVKVLADGKRVLSASYDQTLKLWDLETGAELRTLRGHANGVTAVAVLADGKRALSASWDRRLKLWDLETGVEIRTLSGHASGVTAVAVCADGKRALSASDGHTLKLWDLETGARWRTFSGHSGAVMAVSVFGEGRWALSASGDHTLKLWDVETGADLRTLRGHGSGVTSVALLAEGRRALSGSFDHTLKLWDLETGAERHTHSGHAGGVTSVAVLAGGKRALSASLDYTLKLWDLETGSKLRTFFGHNSSVMALEVLADGKRALSASFDQTLKLWDLETGYVECTLFGHVHSVNRVVVLAVDKRALSASSDKTLKLWDLETGSELRTFTGHAGRVTAVALLAGDRQALSSSSDETLKLWDLETGAELRTFSGHADSVNGVAVLSDGKRALSTSFDRTLKLWDLETASELHTFSGHKGGVTAVAVLADGKRVLSGSFDHTLKLWNLETGAQVRTFRGHASALRGVALLDDGQRALSASHDKTLKLWDLNTGENIATFTAEAAFTTCTLVQDDSLIVGGDALGRIHLVRLVEPSLR